MKLAKITIKDPFGCCCSVSYNAGTIAGKCDVCGGQGVMTCCIPGEGIFPVPVG